MLAATDRQSAAICCPEDKKVSCVLCAQSNKLSDALMLLACSSACSVSCSQSQHQPLWSEVISGMTQAPAVLGWTLVGTALGLQVKVFFFVCFVCVLLMTTGVQLHRQPNAARWLCVSMAIDATTRPRVLVYTIDLLWSSLPA